MCPSFSSSPALPFVPAVTFSAEMSLEEAIGYVASDELIKDVNLWKLIRDFDLHGIRTSGSTEVDNFISLLSKNIFRDEHSRLVVYASAENLVRCILMLFKIFFD
ncbi:uncharacterized protein LOC116404763 isoform X13 [Cucumis sativus]|uniref:uncharacterized protein LOC116404763 isoform X13 n=1 Tax=Cucumis sativus TaxID=3659 RepID=UPI0012F4B26C|nr:uncharacterized protein LOC116404763 isoform X13 [Cucumis sativus]